MGRQSTFSEAIADEICERLSQGEPLAVVCRSENMPDRVTVWRWTEANEDFAQRIARARQIGFDAIADDCLVIADDGQNDAQRDKLRVETRLKLLAKWDPKRYGDKLDLSATIRKPEDALKDLA